jgi:hypothetical protein
VPPGESGHARGRLNNWALAAQNFDREDRGHACKTVALPVSGDWEYSTLGAKWKFGSRAVLTAGIRSANTAITRVPRSKTELERL